MPISLENCFSLYKKRQLIYFLFLLISQLISLLYFLFVSLYTYIYFFLVSLKTYDYGKEFFADTATQQQNAGRCNNEKNDPSANRLDKSCT